MGGDKELIDLLKQKKEGEKPKMCKAIKELIEEGRQEERENTAREAARADAAEARAEKAERELELLKRRVGCFK